MKRIILLLMIIINYFIIDLFPQSLFTQLNKITEEQFFDTSTIAISVYDLTAQKSLYKKNDKLLLHPASNMKILTSSTALLFLTPNYEFKTSLYYSGEIRDSILYGDIFIEGGFDPDFTDKDLDTFITIIKSQGINKINGNIFADISNKDSLFWGNGWMWDDDPSTDAPYLSSLNINDNAITVIIETSKNFSSQIQNPIVRLEPNTNFVKLKNLIEITNSEKTNIEITRDFLNHSNEIIIKGKLNPNYKSNSLQKQLNIINPHLYFLTLFKEKIIENNIYVSGVLDTLTKEQNANLLFSLSRKYSEVIKNLNKESDNLSAEMSFYALSYEFFGKPATAENGIKMIDSLISLCKLNPKNYRIVDGSGVSHYNLVSAELLIETLKYIYYKYPKLYKILYESFPIAGIDGTLERRMRETLAFNNVHAKTGTLSGVSSLSGYLTAKNNHQIAFSILIQNQIKNSRATEYQNKICEILVNYE
ncbi:MAG: D-alanyl-D-alanine carboxypeptidase/D-alanyl-D-alanine-endopeptidase [Ignavibacterium sp.]